MLLENIKINDLLCSDNLEHVIEECKFCKLISSLPEDMDTGCIDRSTICKASSMGLSEFSICEEDNDKRCGSAFSYDDKQYCHCKLRTFFANNALDHNY